MRLGIHYDTGFSPGGKNSRPNFDPAQVSRDMDAIANRLGLSVVRVSGDDPARIETAAKEASAHGLEIWVSPMPCELGVDSMLRFYNECARLAESLGSRTVLVLGCEVSVFGKGFIPGESAYERMNVLANPGPELYAQYQTILDTLNGFLSTAVAQVRGKFGGRVTYASGPWEQIDWRPFDIVGIDGYRDATNTATLGVQLDELKTSGKPLAVTEFGCCTYTGAGDRGASGWTITNELSSAARDEQEQVRYLHDSMTLYARHQIETAFWFTFASWNRPIRQDPERDVDKASFGVVAVDEEGNWRPKAVFNEISKYQSAS